MTVYINYHDQHLLSSCHASKSLHMWSRGHLLQVTVLPTSSSGNPLQEQRKDRKLPTFTLSQPDLRDVLSNRSSSSCWRTLSPRSTRRKIWRSYCLLLRTKGNAYSPRSGDTTSKWLVEPSEQLGSFASRRPDFLRLELFAMNWSILDNPFVLRLLQTRYSVPLIATPPTTYKPHKHFYPDKLLPILIDTIHTFLVKNAIEHLGTWPMTPGFYSPIFLVP